jgi:cytochrome b561
MLFGLGLGVTLLIRIVVRSAGFGGTPPVTAGLLEGLAKLVHLLLYALMAAVVVLGIANGWARGESLFGFYTLFPAPPERALRRTIGGLHELAANAILVVAGLHAVAALFHHYVLRDSVLRRMLPAA